jgi:hypothetical protein
MGTSDANQFLSLNARDVFHQEGNLDFWSSRPPYLTVVALSSGSRNQGHFWRESFAVRFASCCLSHFL